MGFALHTEPNAVSTCGLEALDIALLVDTTGGFGGNVALAITGLPDGVGAAFDQDTVQAGGQASLVFSGLGAATPGLYTLVLTGTGNGDSQSAAFLLNISPALPGAVQPVAPVDGAVNAQLAPLLAWSGQPNADTYTVQVADNPDFAPILFQQTGLVNNRYQILENLPDATTLYWRLRAQNACGEGEFGPAHQFSTAAVACTTLVATGLPMTIDFSDRDTVLAYVTFPLPGIITDVNVPVLKGVHEWINDLQFSLIAPSGTASALLGPVCWDEDGFDVRFDDQAQAPYNTIPCPPTGGGLYQPRTPLSAFNGQDALGDWTLRVIDTWPADGGELSDWSLEVCYLLPPNAGCALSATATITATGCTPCTTDVSLVVTGVAGEAAYLWNDGSLAAARQLVCEGNYSVTVVDAASCAATLEITVAPPTDFLTATATATPAQDTNNGTATATAIGGTAPLTYTWNTGDTTAVIQQLAPGTYTVTISDANGCTATAEVVVELTTGLRELSGINAFHLIPNPTSGQLQVVVAFDDDEAAVLELYNAAGQRLQRSIHRGAGIEARMNLSNHPDGLYFLTVRTAWGSATRVVVLEKGE